MIVEKLFPSGAKRSQTSGVTRPASWFVDWVRGGPEALSGVQVNADSALTVSAIWRGISLVAGDVAKTPMYLYRRQGQGKQIADRHPAYQLIRRKPNPWMTAFDFKRTMTAHAIMAGSGYAWIDEHDGRTILRLLQPSSTWRDVASRQSVTYITVLDGTAYAVPSEAMLHLRNLTWDGVTGIGVVQKAREALGLSIAAERYGAAYFGNSARPNVAITYPTTLTREKKIEMRESWERAHRGIGNSNKVAILEGGVDFKEFGATNEEAQFLATREFQIRDIANWIGVPPHMLGDTTRTAYASIEQENKSYLQVSLDYWMTAWEEECWEKLLTPAEKASEEYVFEFLRKRLISMDAKAEQEVLTLQLNNGSLTVDEVRAMDNRDPLPGGRGAYHRMPLNLGIIGEDGLPQGVTKPEPAAPVPDDTDGDDDPEPNDEPNDDSDDDRRARAVAVLEDAVRRCIRRVTHTAKAAAKKPRRFTAWLDAIPAEHTNPIRDVLVMPLWAATGCDRAEAGHHAAAATEAILSRVAAELLDVTGQATHDQLEAAVAERMASLEFAAADFAAQFTQREGASHGTQTD